MTLRCDSPGFRNLPWGTHLCHLYATKQDLLELAVPFIAAGLDERHLCLWGITAPLSLEEAEQALRRSFPNVDACIAAGQLKLLGCEAVYLKDGRLRPWNDLLDSWSALEAQAKDSGFEGIRAVGDTFWLHPNDWRAFNEYEQHVDVAPCATSA